ncbi:MAG: GatB/YqeY domain-containing protein [Candidatus Saccharimonadales bacterium]|nr:GatB/YqeY domain-containing protein [Candidatus Saccharimonadales bacterium]
MLDKINADLKQAMLDRDELAKTTLQGLKSAIKYAEIDAGHEFDDIEISKLLLKEAKKRKEAIDLYEQGGNQESADKEAKELKIIEGYLPDQPSEEAVAEAVEKAIDDTGASGMKDMGKVMGAVKGQLGDSVDGSLIAKYAREKLS